MKSNFVTKLKRTLGGIGVAGILMTGVAIQSGFAQSSLDKDIWHDQRDIQKDQRELQRDIYRHGYYSPQAERDRADLRHDYRDVQKDRQVQNYRNGYYGNPGYYSNRRDRREDDHEWRDHRWDHDGDYDYDRR
jgi:hypothetical protein